jgi:threonine dehydrogenase-like Zn-dependent dehydrogenase
VPELEHGSLLVETTCATICASDIHIWQGEVPLSSGAFPRILGHEMTGLVAALGPGVRADSVGQPLAVGDRVVWTHGFCGQCEECVVEHQPTICANRRMYMGSPCTEYPYLTGGFAEYCYVFPESGRVKVPDAVPDPLAAAAACAFRTVIHGFDRLGPLDDRHSVLVQGAGPLGLFSVARAVRSGPAQVIVVGGPARRLEVARAWGATHTLDIDEVPDAAERNALVREWTRGKGPDVVVEVSGARSAVAEGLDAIRPGGRYLVIGQVHGDLVPIPTGAIVGKHVQVIGSLSASVEHYYRALQFIERNWERFTWLDLISGTYPFERVNDALVAMQELREVKPALVFETA